MIIHALLAQATKLGTIDSPSILFNSTDVSSGQHATDKLEAVISEFLGIITIVGGVALIFYFALAALNWVTASGDHGKIQQARDQMVQAVIGMVVMVASYGIIGIVSNLLGIHLLNPGQAIMDIVKR